MLHTIDASKVTLNDSFWGPLIERNRNVTLPACLDQCEKTGRIRNFAIASGREEGSHEGRRYNDSDVYKVIEAAARSLMMSPDAGMETRIDAIIDLIAAAQADDGYLNTHYQLNAPDEKWTDIKSGHELYCAGHLLEAGVAYHRATGKRALLDVAIKFADLIHSLFGDGDGQRKEPPGHQEIELALMTLAKETGDEKYQDLASFFLDLRGKTDGRESYGEYAQDHAEVREQTEAVGHAVRLMYQCCGACDIAEATDDFTLELPLDDIWTDIVENKMYITGGIGSSAENEGFTSAHDLPNETAYSETCASIGLCLWAHRMYAVTGHARHLDVLERTLYNAVLAGVSNEGNAFFYDNVLANDGSKRRESWFECACCPTNLVRFIPQVPGLIYSHSKTEIFICNYIGSEATMSLGRADVHIKTETEYPWGGRTVFTVDPGETVGFAIKMRIPSWASKDDVKVFINDEPKMLGDIQRGFLSVRREWSTGDRLTIELPVEPRRRQGSDAVAENAGKVALLCGPVVYCIEGIDHDGSVQNIALPADAELSLIHDDAFLGRGGMLIKAGDDITAIPYASWANREPSPMTVWIDQG